MHPKETLTKTLKLFFGDTRQAIISYIVLALIAMGGGLFALSKTALNCAIQIMTTPTPLWATISLVLLGYLYIYLRFRRASKISPNKTSSIEYFTVGQQKWEATIYDNVLMSINDKPICVEHGLPFIYSDQFYRCPKADDDHCKNVIHSRNHSRIKDIAASYIKKELMARRR